MNLKPYLAAARMSMRESKFFGIGWLLGNYAIRALQVLFLLLLWKSLVQAGGEIDGMTLVQLLAYTLCSHALAPLLDVRTPAGSLLHEGIIVSHYLRPMSIFGQLAAQTLGAAVTPLIVFIPYCALMCVAFGVPLRPATAWFFPSLALCTAQGFAIDFLYACLIIRTGNLSWQVYTLREALFTVFTGGLIPFAAMPWGIGDVLALSPLGTLAGAPLSLFAGLAQPGAIIPVQIFWNVVLWPVCIWCFRRSRERMVSYGG